MSQIKEEQPEVVKRAREFVTEKHAGLFRRNKAQEPAIVHLGEVEDLVKKSGGSVQERTAALLHDSVEDAGVTFAQIRDLFGNEIAVMVEGLTDLPEFTNFHTLDRKTRQAERVRSESRSVKLVKLADQISNVRCIALDPPVNWDSAKCLEYIEGARRVAKECCKISTFLDREFSKVHAVALKEHTQKGTKVRKGDS